MFNCIHIYPRHMNNGRISVNSVLLNVECRHFINCVETGRGRPAIKHSRGHDGLAVVRILEGPTQSLRVGGGTVLLENRT